MVVMEQLPEIALYCHDVGEPLEYVIEEHILPHIITLLSDNFTQVLNLLINCITSLYWLKSFNSCQLGNPSRDCMILTHKSGMSADMNDRPRLLVMRFVLVCKLSI